MNGYSADRQWSDKYIPEIKKVVGPHLLAESPVEVDQKQAADLIVMRARDLAIACRVRRHGFLDRYGWQFTIRSLRDSGAETEMSKIVNGWGDWMFYAHAAPGDQVAFARWLLIDLSHFRAHLMRNPKSLTCGRTANGDGTWFSWFDVRSFPPYPALLVASSEPVPMASKPASVPVPPPALVESDFEIPGFTLPPQPKITAPPRGTLQEPWQEQF